MFITFFKEGEKRAWYNSGVDGDIFILCILLP